jgi:HSP20 family protein
MKLSKNYPLSLAVDSFLGVMDRKPQPTGWFFQDEPVQPEYRPDYRVLEKDEVYEVTFLLPGFDRKEISVSLEGAILSVSASCVESDCKDGFGKSSFSHAIEVPEFCEREKVTAKLESGILKIILPKLKKPKAVKVKIG